MKVFKILLLIILLPLLYVGGQILFGTLTDYQPPEREPLVPAGDAMASIDSGLLTFYIWNIGYAGLGQESDFFLDGGTMTRVSRSLTEKNLEGIASEVASWSDADFILLQEVDEKAKRSYGTDQFKLLHERLGADYAALLAYNYKVNFVPVPFFKPLGQVKAGLATFTPYAPADVERVQFPGNFGWPKRIYFLDRCFMVARFPANGKELVVINTHNSAYDDGSLKVAQMEFLKSYIQSEYDRGNYVVVGGDWNQCPPGYDCLAGRTAEEIGYDQKNISAEYMPGGWSWAYDATVKTNRKLSAPYRPGETFTTIIDFYLVSPNVEVVGVSGRHLDFAYSDHQPVRLQVSLK